MLDAPPPSARNDYVAVADVVHLAIANLGTLLLNDESIPLEEATIRIDLAAENQPPQHYYFDPRLIIRGLEVARGDQISFALTPLEGQKALFYFMTKREDCLIHCALHSSASHSTSAPLTTLIIREARPPMADGAWVLPRSR
jgi:hypothetical protein